jgi:glutamine synthetase
MASSYDWVWQQIQDNDVKFVKFWFTDILGFLKSLSVPVEEMDKALEEGIGFDGSSIKGFTRIDESDMVAMPDADTFTILPWRPRERAVARMFCDIHTPDHQPYDGDPRQVLRRNLKKAREMGFTFYVGPEAEYFYFRGANEAEPLDQGGYFDLTPRDEAIDLRRETVLALEEMGIYVEYSHHEVAPSQHEIDLRYTDALTMADTLMTYRMTVKEVAYMNGVYATFMPKPLFGKNGSGMHVHQSLFRGEDNAFFDAKDDYHLSAVARQYIAGILKYVPEFIAVTNQWVNSYKRLVPGYEAPVYISWAQRNRSNLIRIPMYKPGKEEATRIELRNPDPACNPYLAFSVMLAAGLRGIEEQLECPPPLELDLYTLDPAERARLGIMPLPTSLHEAIDLCEGSDLVREALGEHVHREFIANKRIEWERYRTHVTDFELSEYLPLL